ncbi:MAG: EamA family transporter [Clostridia bacterium]
MCIGMALLVLSLALINYAKSDRKKNVRWLLYVFVAFMGNGLCSTVQKAQQVAFGGQYKNEFMIVSLAGVSVILLICSLFLERKQLLSSIRRGWYLAVPCGILNGLTNLFVLLLSTKIAASLMFPILSGGNVVLTSLISVWGFHEKLNRRQLAGIALGVASIILLSL